ncbi:MAG: SCO family protein, partial [Gallionella sp.]|nr:SCO family protein [Gallionella sp.]
MFLLLLVALLAGCEKPKLPSPFHASDIGAMFTEADFRLTDHNGKTRTLADFRGNAVALFFGYTNFQDMCTTTLADLAQAV